MDWTEATGQMQQRTLHAGQAATLPPLPEVTTIDLGPLAPPTWGETCWHCGKPYVFIGHGHCLRVGCPIKSRKGIKGSSKKASNKGGKGASGGGQSSGANAMSKGSGPRRGMNEDEGDGSATNPSGN